MSTTPFPRMHVSYYVTDINKTIQFYKHFFGIAPVKAIKHYAKFELANPALIISFNENPKQVKPAFGHLGFQVETEEELMKIRTKMLSLNLPVRDEMGAKCCFALQDKFWVTDPDGYQWEVYLFHEDVEFNDPHYDTKEEGPCCVSSEKSDSEDEACFTPSGEKKKLSLAELNPNRSSGNCC